METSLEIQKRVSEAENYSREIIGFFSQFMGKRVIEVGCGFGHMTMLLLKKSELVCCVDISKDFISFVRKRFAGKKNFPAVLVDMSSKKILALKKRRFDTILCLNVLEHIKQDDVALKNFFYILPNGGRLLLLVPAFGFLFGSMDRADNHYRRYRKKILWQKLEKAGFKVEKMCYQNVFGMFGWFVNGRLLKKKYSLKNSCCFLILLCRCFFDLKDFLVRHSDNQSFVLQQSQKGPRVINLFFLYLLETGQQKP